ncbi:MAG TPA: SOS response-associated peptidase [Bacteroidales bacterium]|nr:SOS response-associated peptidase [Bacteroidales bacterium]HPF03910.1 SOS response-associated peptidase [Bacteroidales bacterium]HPJ59618.1 SOS response-associated peptidase [Bacteroidales bacterium]HPR10931.1 SOS response-associated peptidase [Bacteroidales bacterium]HRW84108.1 SOS response-associated peptidase [Bacteroidales bacterium]
MCFTVNVNLVKDEIEERYGISFPSEYRYEPSYYYHAFNLPELPAICSGKDEYIDILRWGLIPSWVKSASDADEIRMKTFNARSETISTKASFAESFRSMRCVIPVSGFYEWQHRGNVKVPWYIFPADEKILSLAGLYSKWIHADTGENVYTFSIVTTEANELMSEIHNSGKRMPAILERNVEKKWLDVSLPINEISNLLKPAEKGVLKAHTIGPLIRDRYADRNTPALIEPYNYNANTLFPDFNT